MHNLKVMETAFYQSESDQPHPGRARALIRAHPEVRELMVRNPWTALIAVSIVILQTVIACGMGKLGFSYWWLSLVLAFCIGAFANHANYVIIHDATHNLIFRSPSWNKMVAVIADLPNLTPGAMGFRVFHLKHHSHQGDYEWDADLANHWEARLVGNKWYRKAIWLMLFPFFSGNAAASIESRQNVGPLVLHQSGMRDLVRCRDRLFLRLGRISLSRVRVLIFDWTASGRRALDSGALHVRFRPGDV